MPAEGSRTLRSRRSDDYASVQAHLARHDEEIAAELDDRLTRDERLDAHQMTVAVASGIITLSGEVDTLQAKRAAGEDAWSVAGTNDVRNLLRVRDRSTDEGTGLAGPVPIWGAARRAEEGTMANDRRGQAGLPRYYYGYYGPYWMATTRDDAEIAEDVRNRLVWDSWVDAERVNVQVENRVVTLDGEVDSIVAKRSSGDDAWDTPGVLDVINNLRIRQSELEQ